MRTQFILPDDYSDQPESSGMLEIYNPAGFSLPLDQKIIDEVVQEIEKREKVRFHKVELVYVDEHEIIQINRKYLEKEYVTDIISFRYDDQNSEKIEGTLYCCAPRIAEQAAEFGTGHKEEFLRVFIHGMLHLSGYEDNTPEAKKNMSALEELYLEHIATD